MNISLPDSLQGFVDIQVEEGGFGTSSKYVLELIRRDQDRVRLRALLLAGAASPAGEAVAPDYLAKLRAEVDAAGKVARPIKATP